MTKEELKKEYGENNVFDNQFEMGKFIQEYGIRNKFNNIELKYPTTAVKRDSEIFYDIAERALVKNVAFFNDNCYIIEDFADIKVI